ncbi:MAG: hypothetical protein ACJ71Y_18615 [Blastococcus sp.]
MPAATPPARSVLGRIVAVVAVAAAGLCGMLALGLTAAAPAAAAGKDPVTVQVQCVWDNGDGTRTAVWNYTSTSSQAVDVPVGTDNRFTTQPDDRGQPTHFLPGVHLNAWVVTYADASLAWHVMSGGDTANNGSTPCASRPVSVIGDWRAAALALAVLLPGAWLAVRRIRPRWAAIRTPQRSRR